MTKRAAWLSDTHLNFLEDVEGKQRPFLDRVKFAGADIVLISGDIGEAPSVERYLRMLEDHLRLPTFFVLGNHDFYFGSIERTRREIAELADESEHLIYLTQGGVIEVSPATCIVGHDGWADARFGDYAHSDVRLNDYYLIEELKGLGIRDYERQLHALGDEAAEKLREDLTRAAESYRHLVVVTHVPPFREACWHQGRISDDNYLPHFSCKATGDVLREMASRRTNHSFSVLCGHTHSPGEVRILDNLAVSTAGTDYGRPVIERIIDLE